MHQEIEINKKLNELIWPQVAQQKFKHFSLQFILELKIFTLPLFFNELFTKSQRSLFSFNFEHLLKYKHKTF